MARINSKMKLMKQYILYTIAFFTIALFSISCSDEDKLTPSDIDNMSRFDFPEGDSEADRIFADIDETYGVKIIYKSWTEKDWTKKWTNPGGGAISYNGFGRYFVSGEVDSTLVVAEFMRDHIFAHLGYKILKGHKPYIYLVNSFGTTMDLGVISFRGYQLYSDEGLDFVIYSPYATYNPSYTAQGFHQLFTPNNEAEKYKVRSRMIYKKIILNAINKGTLVEPDGFSSGLDYTTKLDVKDPSKSDYFLNRGFIKLVNTLFTSEGNPNTDPLKYGSTDSDDPKGAAALFPAYIRLAMYKNEDAVKEQYKEYQPIMDKYDQVVKYMLEEYGVDLQALAERY